MKRYLPFMNLVLLLVLIGTNFWMHRQYQKIVHTETQVIDLQRKAIMNWQLRALACEASGDVALK